MKIPKLSELRELAALKLYKTGTGLQAKSIKSLIEKQAELCGLSRDLLVEIMPHPDEVNEIIAGIKYDSNTVTQDSIVAFGRRIKEKLNMDGVCIFQKPGLSEEIAKNGAALNT